MNEHEQHHHRFVTTIFQEGLPSIFSSVAFQREWIDKKILSNGGGDFCVTQEPPTTVTQEPPTTQDPTTGVTVSTCSLKDPGELKMLEIPGCGGWVDLSCDKGCLNIQKVIKHYKGKRMK